MLHSERLQSGGGRAERWIVMAHGAFGQGRNWAGIGRRVVEQRPQWGVLLVDLRGHGRSTGLAGEPSLAEAARDLQQLAATFDGRIAAGLGHSFGGKVMLAWAAEAGQGGAAWPVEQLWIIDSTPSPLEAASGEAWRMLQLVRETPGPFRSRAAAGEALEARGVASPIAAWMTMNLERTDAGLEWRFDVAELQRLFADFYAADLWPVVEDAPAELHFVKAESSEMLAATDVARIEAAGRARLHRLQGGHWLNSDNPEGLVQLLSDHLPE